MFVADENDFKFIIFSTRTYQQMSKEHFLIIEAKDLKHSICIFFERGAGPAGTGGAAGGCSKFHNIFQSYFREELLFVLVASHVVVSVRHLITY